MNYNEYTTTVCNTGNLIFNNILKEYEGCIIRCTLTDSTTITGILIGYNITELVIYDIESLKNIHISPELIALNSIITVVINTITAHEVKPIYKQLSYSDYIIGSIIFNTKKISPLEYLLITDGIHDSVVQMIRFSPDYRKMYIKPLSEKFLSNLYCFVKRNFLYQLNENNTYTYEIQVDNLHKDVRIIHLTESYVLNAILHDNDTTKPTELTELVICNKPTFDFLTAIKYLLDGEKVRCTSWCNSEYIYLDNSKDFPIYTEKGTQFTTSIWFWKDSLWELFMEG